MSAKDALLVASRAVTLALHPNAKDDEKVWLEHVVRDFQLLSPTDRLNVVTILAGLAAKVLANEPDPEAYLERILLGVRARLGVDA